jgi:hypothetical protein
MWSGPPARNAGFPAGAGADKNVGVAGWKACSTIRNYLQHFLRPAFQHLLHFGHELVG